VINNDSYEYVSKKYKTKYRIEIADRDGTFLAVPTFDGKRADFTNCRSSTAKREALDSVISEVLEKMSPAQIFGQA